MNTTIPANMREDLALNQMQDEQESAARWVRRDYYPKPNPSNAGQWDWLNKEGGRHVGL